MVRLVELGGWTDEPVGGRIPDVYNAALVERKVFINYGLSLLPGEESTLARYYLALRLVRRQLDDDRFAAKASELREQEEILHDVIAKAEETYQGDRPRLHTISRAIQDLVVKGYNYERKEPPFHMSRQKRKDWTTQWRKELYGEEGPSKGSRRRLLFLGKKV